MMQDARQRRIIIGAASVAALVIITVGFIISWQSQGDTSGQGVDFTGNQDPNADYTPPTTAAVNGLDGLVNTAGLTLNQAFGVQAALQDYSPFNNGNTYIDIATNTFQLYPPSANDPLNRRSVSTHITVNSKATYQITCYFWGTNTIELLIYDSTGKTKLFDSGTITGNS